MTEQDLRALIQHHEADCVEFTLATKDTDKFSEAVCAFANDLPSRGRPGYLIVGVSDAGQFGRLAVSDELLRNLGGLRDDGNIQPLPAITIEKVVTTEGDVAVVTVFPSLLPPVRYRGCICVRLGPRRGFATEHEERMLIDRRVSHARTFDAQPCLDGLMPMAMEARKPVFSLKPADGAIGAHGDAVRHAYEDFLALARRIASKAGAIVR